MPHFSEIQSILLLKVAETAIFFEKEANLSEKHHILACFHRKIAHFAPFWKKKVNIFVKNSTFFWKMEDLFQGVFKAFLRKNGTFTSLMFHFKKGIILHFFIA